MSRLTARTLLAVVFWPSLFVFWLLGPFAFLLLSTTSSEVCPRLETRAEFLAAANGTLPMVAVQSLLYAVPILCLVLWDRLLPASATERLVVTEWLMWQAANFGPTLGYAHYFLTYYAGHAPFAETRFAADVARLYRTLNDRLSEREFVASDFSIADIAIWPWVSRFARHKINLDDFPAVQRWYRRLGQQESFQRGYRVPFATSDVPGL